MDKFEVLISVNRRISLRRVKFLQAFTILNNDLDKDVNNEKDDIFETITAKEQVMIFFMTKDFFFLQGFWQLKDNYEMIKINFLLEIKKVGNKLFKVIIDTYYNYIFDEEAIKFLEKLDAERIIVLALYYISKLKAKALIYFVSCKESIKNFFEITYGKHLLYKNLQLCFLHNQFKIMQLILKNKNESNITLTLNILQQTLKIQKFNIMYKLKLRRMSDIVTLGITFYFQLGHKQLKLMAGMTRDADADFITFGDY